MGSALCAGHPWIRIKPSWNSKGISSVGASAPLASMAIAKISRRVGKPVFRMIRRKFAQFSTCAMAGAAALPAARSF